MSEVKALDEETYLHAMVDGYLHMKEFLQSVEEYLDSKEENGMMKFTAEVAKYKIEKDLQEAGESGEDIAEILKHTFSVDADDLFKS